MSKKSFLIPVTVAVTALVSVAQPAPASVPENSVPAIHQSQFTPTGDLVLNRAVNPAMRLADHESHSSHDSHSSHESHSSHSSGGY